MKMGGIDEANIDMMRRIQSSLGTFSKQTSQHDTSNLNSSQMCNPNSHFRQNFSSVENGKRSGGIPPSYPNHIPPISPYSQIPVSRNATTTHQLSAQSFSSGPSQGHSRSLSQSSFFSFDSLPPLSPSPYRGDSSLTSTSDQGGLVDVSMGDRDSSPHTLLPSRGSGGLRVGENLPPSKSHRRSNCDKSFGYSTVIQSSPPFLPLKGVGRVDHMMSGRENPGSTNLTQFVKTETTSGESNNIEGELVDDLFSAYMNLDNIDTLNSSGTDEKHGNENREDLDSRVSGTKTNDSSENEAESSVNLLLGKRESVKRSAGCDITPTTRHHRSLSMDSFMNKMQCGDQSPKFPPIGARHGQHSPRNPMDGNVNSFSLEFGNGEFAAAELKKIMANDKLAELAISDPKRVKRILANRQSAALSKERKMRYISELEHKVQTLQIEATTLSAQLTMLQRDSVGLTSQNNELKFRIHSMEQQGKLRDALNETLTAEVQRLKLNTTNGESHSSKCRTPQQAFKMAQQQQSSDQLNLHQMQLQEPQQQAPQPRDGSKTKAESK